MWVSRSEIEYLRERVRELEADLKDERAANRRREEWAIDMLMRRSGTYPMPPIEPAREKKSEPVLMPITESDIAKAAAVREEGKRLGLTVDEIREGVQVATGWGEDDIARAIAGNGHV